MGEHDIRAVELVVTGRVQGVSFRMHAQSQARRLAVTGWVSNEPDGSVAAHVEGEAAAVAAFVEWCRSGPPYARVDGVRARDVAAGGARGFEVRY